MGSNVVGLDGSRSRPVIITMEFCELLVEGCKMRMFLVVDCRSLDRSCGEDCVQRRGVWWWFEMPVDGCIG